jgi:Response regulators consisting of a CheY-like receiver domain and a winged-helix DNA-binding domain
MTSSASRSTSAKSWARISAIQARSKGPAEGGLNSDLRIFSDGRDPEVKGEVLPLPRRERRILEFLAANRGRRLTKSQIFNFVYGLFSEDIDENVVESHISKLRKRPLSSDLAMTPSIPSATSDTA